MASLHQQSVKSLNTSGGPKRFIFKSNARKIQEIKINVYRNLETRHAMPKNATFMLDELLKWRELDTTKDFMTFFVEMMPLVQTSELILYYKEKIFSELMSRINMKAHLSLESILELVVAFCRDILQDFIETPKCGDKSFLERFVDFTVNILKDGGCNSPDTLEQVFTSWHHMIEYLQKYLIKNVVSFLNVTAPIRFFENYNVQDLMADAVSLLLRTLSKIEPSTEIKKGMKSLINEVAESPTSVKKAGTAALLFHTMKGTSSKLNSKVETIFRLMICKSFLSFSNASHEGSEAVLEVVTDVIERIWVDLDHKEFNRVYECLIKEIYNSVEDGCTTHLSRLLSLLKTATYHSNTSQLYDSKTLLEVVRRLIQMYIVPNENVKSGDNISEVINEILELILCLLDDLTIASNLSSISLTLAPVFKLKNSELLFVKRLLQKDTVVVQGFLCQIISSMNNLIEESPEEVLYLMLQCFGEKLQSFGSLAMISSEEISKICNFLKETLNYWINFFSGATLSNNQSNTSISKSDLAVLWGVLECYPHFQHLSDSAPVLNKLICSLDQFLETEAEAVAEFPKLTWQCVLGAALLSYHKLLLQDRTRYSEISTFLKLAKRNRSCSQIVFAVAEFLDSMLSDTSLTEEGLSKEALHELGVDDAMIAVAVFSDNLSLQNKELRLSTLRILSHYDHLDPPVLTSEEPPLKKLKTDETESCRELPQNANVIDVLLSIEMTPVSVSTGRKLVNTIVRLEKIISSSNLNPAYIPLVLNGTIGILHNRLSYVWEPASDCLAKLLKNYKNLVLDTFVRYLSDFQLEFLLSSKQLEKMNPENLPDDNLVDCFDEFLAPDFDSTQCGTVIIQLLKSLQEVPELVESQSRDIVPVFLQFLGYSGENLSSVEAFKDYSCSGKDWRMILKEWLNLLKRMRNARALYQSQFIKEILSTRLLDEVDSDIQSRILDCLLNWKDEGLVPYGEHLKNLIFSKNLRDELTRWSVSKDSLYVLESHRNSLIPILIRLLTPKVRNLKTLGSRKHISVGHRRAILCFLTQLNVDELPLFFSLLLNPLRPTCCKNIEESPHPSTLVKYSNKKRAVDVSWKIKSGFLNVVEDILRTFDELHTRPFLNQMMRIVVQILESCMLGINIDPRGHDTDKKASVSPKQLKGLRSSCLKIISFAINKYDTHDYGCDFWDTFFKAVKRLIDGFKQESSSSEKASSLFSCFLAMSRNPTLVILLAQEANLVPNIFSILTVKTASDAIITSVFSFIENLLILDEESENQENDPIKKVLQPHLAVLIDSFHGLFDSRKDVNRKSFKTFGKTELRIFKRLMKYINNSSTAEQFVGILLPICKKKVLNSDECLEALHIIKGLLPVITEKLCVKVLVALNPLLASAKLELRLCICEILQGLSAIDPSLTKTATLLNELNAISSTEIDEFDYDRRIRAYNDISMELFSSLKEEQALTILSQCMHDLSSDELILRQSASNSLLSFVLFAASILNNNKEDKEETGSSIIWTKVCILRIIKKTLLQNIGEAIYKDNSVQKEWVDLLREMIYHLHQVTFLSSLKILCSDDLEVDFFKNIVHLQLHRRGRALTRFRNAVDTGTLSESVVLKIFVPLFYNMMLDVKGGKEHMKNACLETLASISGQMQWNNYRGLLMKCFTELKFRQDNCKLMIRLICAVLDRFHFCNTDEIQIFLQKQVYPKFMELVKSDSENVNVKVSLAALKLLKLLPEETMEAHMHSIIKRLCNFLKHGYESIRDEARTALAACTSELGIEKFHIIIKDLKAALQRGSHLHILGYTLNFILSKMLTNPLIGKLDYCLEDLLSIIENDIFGEVAEQKEVQNFASKMKETKKMKSFDSLKLIAENVTFRTHAVSLLSPIKARLQKHLTPKTKSKLEQMLHQIALGIDCNPTTELSEFLIFVYGLVEDGISESSVNSNNNHLIVGFALGLLSDRLKKLKLDRNDEKLLSMLDPFVLLLGKCLNSKYEVILSTSFRCLGPLLKLPLPSLNSEADKIKILLLDISQNSSDSRSPLVQSCLKLLTLLLRSTMVSLSDEQLRTIIRFPMFIDLLTNPSPIALSLLKSIISRKLVVHEIYDVVVRVGELMVTSQEEPVRKKCGQILFQFLNDYYLTEKRLKQHLNFLLSNLNYEHSSGREAVLEMLHIIIIKSSKEKKSALNKQIQTFFLHLVVALANEGDHKVRSMISTVLKELFARASDHDLNSILDYSLSWYTSAKQHLWSAAAQVLGLLVESMKKGFNKHVAPTLQVAKQIFTSAINATRNIKFSNDSGIPFWKEAYYSLLMFEAVVLHLPDLSYDSDSEAIWEMILKFLLHPHLSLRNISSRLVSLYFSYISNMATKNQGPKSFYLANSSKLFYISVSLLKQLKAKVLIDDATNTTIIQNLVFSICSLHTFAEDRSTLEMHEFWSSLQNQDQVSYLEAFQILGSSDAKYTFVLATTGNQYADENQLKKHVYNNLQSFIVTPLFKKMGKIATEFGDVQMKIVFNCFKMISSQIGPQACEDYAFYMLMPLYKVCEGFIGKIVNDEMKQLAEEVRDGVRDLIGVEKFVEIYNEIRKKLKGKRDGRKNAKNLIAAVNPMLHAKRKLKLTEKHRAHKKRKVMSRRSAYP